MDEREVSRGGCTDRRAALVAGAFDASAFGIVVTDPAANILTVNPSFTRITGYEPGEAEGQNARLLQSGRHDAAFYRRMWDELVRTGHWEAEVWDRRKDGRVYAERLAVTAIRDAQGRTRNYVGVFSEITEQKNTEAQLRELAFVDPLTGLPNRALLGDRIERALAAARRDGSRVAVLFVDLDGFKRLNDRFGHDVGDRTLTIVADCLVMNVRESDTVARVGGDEFVVLIPDLADAQHAARVADKIRDSLLAGIEVQGHDIALGASIGISVFPDDGGGREDLLRRADEAMYAAKRRGNRRRMPRSRRRVQARLRLVTLGCYPPSGRGPHGPSGEEERR